MHIENRKKETETTQFSNICRGEVFGILCDEDDAGEFVINGVVFEDIFMRCEGNTAVSLGDNEGVESTFKNDVKVVLLETKLIAWIED
jgi:hypothetical protein